MVNRDETSGKQRYPTRYSESNENPLRINGTRGSRSTRYTERNRAVAVPSFERNSRSSRSRNRSASHRDPSPPEIIYTRNLRSSNVHEHLDESADDELVVYKRVSSSRTLRKRKSRPTYSECEEPVSPMPLRQTPRNKVTSSPINKQSPIQTRVLVPKDEGDEGVDTTEFVRRSTRIRTHAKEVLEKQDENEAGEEDEDTEEDADFDDTVDTKAEANGDEEEEDDEDESEEEESEEESEEEPERGRYSMRQNRKAPDRLDYRCAEEIIHRDPSPHRGYIQRDARRTAVANRYPARKRARIQSSSSSSDDEPAARNRRARVPKTKRAADVSFNNKSNPLAALGGIEASKAALTGDMTPIKVDPNTNFDSVGGHDEIKIQLKQMVILPILYPEFYSSFSIKPPKGCLFVGPPGTGKTLLARALASECQKIANQTVSVYVRNGADVLSKWVGESERQLRMLFEEAQRNAPAIIFFDEIDGLTPTRSSRQDHCHTSIVTTFLALLDGLQSRGDIVVIGATNRVDMIDSALRRPGRFDTEFYFSLPDEKTRKEIIKIHTSKWKQSLDLDELAGVTGGYNGADLALLTSEAAMFAFRRSYPQIYTSESKLQINEKQMKICAQDWHDAMQKITPSSQRLEKSSYGRVIPWHLKSLLEPACEKFCDHIYQSIFCMPDVNVTPTVYLPPVNPILSLKDLSLGHTGNVVFHRPRVLLTGADNFGQDYLTEYFLYKTTSTYNKVKVIPLDISRLTADDPVAQIHYAEREAHVKNSSARNIIYLGNLNQLEKLLPESIKLYLIEKLQAIPSHSSSLILAYTLGETLSENPETLAGALFPETVPEKIYDVDLSSYNENIHKFIQQIVVDAVKTPPVMDPADLAEKFQELPVVPMKPREIDPEILQRREVEEEHTMLLLRQTLRDVIRDLQRDPRFRLFCHPVDTEEVEDYNEVIEDPMDLSTISEKIDTHSYQTVRQFLQDIDLICENALEYNDNVTDQSRTIRQRACQLRDTSAFIAREEIEQAFEEDCERIHQARIARNATTTKNAPKYYYAGSKDKNENKDDEEEIAIISNNGNNKCNDTSVIGPGGDKVASAAQEVHNLSFNHDVSNGNMSYDGEKLVNGDLSNHGQDLDESSKDYNHDKPSKKQIILIPGSISWMQDERQTHQSFDTVRMKAMATSTAKEAIRVGHLCWIEYASEYFTAKVHSVRLSSFNSVQYQITCPSLPKHCKNDWVVSGRVCDYIHDGKPCYADQGSAHMTSPHLDDSQATVQKKKARRKVSAWRRGVVPNKRKSTTGKPNNTVATADETSRDVDENSKTSTKDPDSSVLEKSCTNPYKQVHNLSSTNLEDLEISQPSSEKGKSRRSTRFSELKGTKDHFYYPGTAMDEFVQVLTTQCIHKHLNVPQLEELYSIFSICVEKHKHTWDRTALVEEMREKAINFFLDK